MMLRYLGWTEAADLVNASIEKTIADKQVTYDLARLITGATELKTSEFADGMISEHVERNGQGPKGNEP